MHLGGPLPCGRVTPYRAAKLAARRSRLPGRPASPSIRVTVVAAEPVAPVLLLPGPRFCPESLQRSMMGSGEVRSSKLTARA
jgi:hypothetical protein